MRMRGNMQENISLQEMLHKLLEIDDETWGLYAFSRELLNKRIQPDKKAEMITKAITCGKDYAKQIIRQCGSSDVRTISEKLKLDLQLHNTPMIGQRILFARYTPPDKIEIMEEPVQQAVMLNSKEEPFLVEHFQPNDIVDIILGHEMFHYVEDQNVDKIYTRTEKILLWSFLGYKNYSVIRTLGDIGAMAFTKELNRLSYSPFILDVLLYYGYDSANARKIYYDVISNEVMP